MTRAYNNEKGIALISTLMLMVLGFAVVTTLLRLITAETKMARLEQSYATALDAAKGGTDMFIFMVQNGLSSPPNPGIGTGSSPHAGQCLKIKMSAATGNWTSAAAWGSNSCPNQATAINGDPTVEPDITMTLSGYAVSVKIVDTITTQPNSNPPPAPCQSGCYYYTVNARAQAPGSNEHADISFLYRYDM